MNNIMESNPYCFKLIIWKMDTLGMIQMEQEIFKIKHIWY